MQMSRKRCMENISNAIKCIVWILRTHLHRVLDPISQRGEKGIILKRKLYLE